MEGARRECFDLGSEMDIVRVRKVVRTWAVDAGFSLVDQTKIVTAASEIARNTLVYGGGGTLTLELLRDSRRLGLRLAFHDEGPGIENIDVAMRDGFTSGHGLGHGLGGAARLMSEFDIVSAVGEGTTVTMTRWRST